MTSPKVPKKAASLKHPSSHREEPAQPKPALERLHKFLSRAGIASRRQGEKLILERRVQVDGRIVDVVGVQIDPEKDRITVDGRLVVLPARVRTIMLHKPAGYVTTMSDPEGRRKVTDLLAGQAERLFPIGRLDYDAAGLLLVTNDGELANRLMHPRYKVPKIYRVTVTGNFDRAAQERLSAGVLLEGRPCIPAKVQVLKTSPDRSVIELTIREGKYHQVKRMFSAVGYQVVKLKRVAYGPLRLGRLAPGAWRELTSEELIELKKAADG